MPQAREGKIIIMAKKVLFTGSAVAIVTPFDGFKTDLEKLGELIEMHIAKKTDAIVICGTTGEASTMPDEEHLAAIKYTCDRVAGRVPVIAGTGSNDTEHAIRLSKAAEEFGADGILTVTPYYNKTTQKGLYEHFKAIAESITIPVVLYNVPSRTGMSIGIETLKKLAEIDNIVAIKEASGDISLTVKIAAEIPDLAIYSGNDDMIVPMMSMGALGVISVLANVEPEKTHDMCEYCLNGDYKSAAKLQTELLELVNALFIEVNPIPVKTALNLMGWNVGNLRAPLTEMEPENLSKLKSALISSGIEVK